MAFLNHFVTTARLKERKRAPQAKATIAKVLSRQRCNIRRITGFALLLRLAPVLLPVVLKFLLSPILHRRNLVLMGHSWAPQDLLLLLVAAGVFVAIIRGLANYQIIARAGRCGHALVADLRTVMFEHVLRLPVSYVDRRGTGKILLRFLGDSDALRNWTSRTLPTVRADIVLIVVLIAGMFWLQWQLACLVLLPLPLLLLLISRLSSRLHQLTLRARLLQAKFTGHVQSRFDVIRQAKWIDSEHGLRESAGALADEIARLNAERDRCAAKLNSTGNVLAFLSVPILIWFGMSRVWNADMTTGEFIAFIWLAAHLSVAIQRLSSAVVIREKARVSIQRILRLLERSAESGRGSDQAIFKSEDCSVRCEELVFCETGPGSVDQPFNCEWVGAGLHYLDPCVDAQKLFEVVLGFRRPSQGGVFLDGRPLGRFNIISVRRAIGWIPQSPAIFDATIEENICVAKPDANRAELMTILQNMPLVDVDPFSWLDRQAGPDGHHLNAREVLVISVARILLRRPQIILVESPQLEVIVENLESAGLSGTLILAARAPNSLSGYSEFRNAGEKTSLPHALSVNATRAVPPQPVNGHHPRVL